MFAGKAFWHEPGLADEEAAPDPHPSAIVQSESTCHSSSLIGPLRHFTVQLRDITFTRPEILTCALDTEDRGEGHRERNGSGSGQGQGCNRAVPWGCWGSSQP